MGMSLKQEVGMEKKKWYRSKTVWTSVVTVVLATYNSASVQFGLPAVPEFVYGVLAAFGIYSRVTATTKIA